MKKKAARIALGILLIAAGIIMWGVCLYAADTYTTNYNLRLPDLDVEDQDTPWGQKYNNNFTTLDTALIAISVNSSSNSVVISSLQVSTGALKTQADAIAVDTGTNTSNIATNTAAIAALKLSTGPIAGNVIDIAALKISSAALESAKLNRGGDTATGTLTFNPTSISTGNIVFRGGYPHSIQFNNESATSGLEFLGEVQFAQSGTGKSRIIGFGDTHASYPKELQIGSDLSGSGTNIRITGNPSLNPDVFISSWSSVGINNAAPNYEYKLDVNGKIRSSDAISSTRYQISGSTIIVRNGPNNISFGLESGLVNIGDYNTFIGDYTGKDNTSGHNNTFVGYQSGQSNNGGWDNSFLGMAAGVSNTSGHANTFAGNYAGYYNTSGYRNTFIGMQAGYDNQTGWANTYVGYSPAKYGTIGSSNVIVGYVAGIFNEGDYNTYVGMETGNHNTGSNNTLLGALAGSTGLYQAETDQKSTFTNCTMIGYEAGKDSVSGLENSFIGYGSGRSNISGSSNTYVGAYSGYPGTTAYENSILGWKAGLALTSGYENLFLGTLAGSGNTTGSTNIFLGYNSGYINTTGAGNILIGYQINAPTLNTNNYLNIGNIYKAQLDTSSATITANLYVDENVTADNFIHRDTAFISSITLSANTVMTPLANSWVVVATDTFKLTVAEGTYRISFKGTLQQQQDATTGSAVSVCQLSSSTLAGVGLIGSSVVGGLTVASDAKWFNIISQDVYSFNVPTTLQVQCSMQTVSGNPAPSYFSYRTNVLNTSGGNNYGYIMAERL